MKAELFIFTTLLLAAIALPNCTATKLTPADKQQTQTTLPAELKQRIDKHLGELARIEHLTRYGINERFVDILLQDRRHFANALSYLKYQSRASTNPKVRMQLQRIEIKKYVERGITGSLLDEFPGIFTCWTASDARDRRDIIHALGCSKHPDALEVLLSALCDPDRRVRIAAAGALGQLKDERAVEPLIKALCDADRGASDETKMEIPPQNLHCPRGGVRVVSQDWRAGAGAVERGAWERKGRE